MVALKDETGNRYGRLLVLSRADNHNGRARWLCKCECGNEHNVAGTSLRRGLVQSCGCLADSLRLPEGEVGLTEFIRLMRHGAKRRGYEWSLSREQVRVLTSRPCYYCGVEPEQTIRNGHAKYTHNGIDRMNNGLGYTEVNCVPCCKHCNIAKNTRTVQEFIAWAVKIVNTQTERRG